MARVRVRVIGEDRILARLRDIIDAMKSGSANGSRDAAEFIKDRAQELVPVDTGRLRDSIRVTEVGPRTFTVGPGDEVEYAEYVEFGTSRMAAQPYMRPAAELARREFPQRVARRIRSEM